MAKTRLSQLRQLAAMAGTASALALSSCALPLEDSWSKVRHEGPLSYVGYEVGKCLDPQSRQFAQNAPTTRQVDILGAGRTLTARWEPGVPGFVRSPYTYPPRLVDVGGALPGSVVVCPYSRKAFVVPYYPAYVTQTTINAVESRYRSRPVADKNVGVIY